VGVIKVHHRAISFSWRGSADFVVQQLPIWLWTAMIAPKVTLLLQSCCGRRVDHGVPSTGMLTEAPENLQDSNQSRKK
jgi:hypothetical protein